ncbi:MAG: hypothetical protein EOL87_10005 [Spartobacteria bacterium]|nr:hypothetical protein [Spartobacteria bacterium]
MFTLFHEPESMIVSETAPGFAFESRIHITGRKWLDLFSDFYPVMPLLEAHGVALQDEASGCECSLVVDVDAQWADSAFRLSIAQQSIQISAGGTAGCGYALQTLYEIIRQSHDGIPCLIVLDAPDYEKRAFFLDISRGKIPDNAVFDDLLEQLLFLRYNQLIVNFEHAFAFPGCPSLSAGADALSGEEWKAICTRFYAVGIEVIPCLSTFGHSYRLVHTHRYQHLNELPFNAMTRPFSFRDSMTHYTLNVSDSEVTEVLQPMIEALQRDNPSSFFHIGCDETFDLGKGKNAAKAESEGVASLFSAHVQRVITCVCRSGGQPMIWGDMLLKYPEAIDALSCDTTVMHWDYRPEPDESFQLFAEKGFPFYVCAGSWSWRRFVNDYALAEANIRHLVRLGKGYGAKGFCLTDWGDIGHVNALPLSHPLMVLAALECWRVGSADESGWNKRLESMPGYAQLEHPLDYLRQLAACQVVTWENVALWVDPSPDIPADWFDEKTGFPAAVMRLSLNEIMSALETLDDILLEEGEGGTVRDAAVCNGKGVRIVLLIARAMHLLVASPVDVKEVQRLSDQVRIYEAVLSRYWHRFNRPSEYWRVKCTLLEIADKLEAMSIA